MADDAKVEKTKVAVPLPLRMSVAPTVIMIAVLFGLRQLNQAAVFPPVEMDAELGPELANQREDAREVWIPVGDGLELYGWVQGPDTASRKIIQFGGNAEFVGPNAETYAGTIAALDAQFLLFNYRGYANSPGRPSESALYADARHVYWYAVHELGWKPSEIILWGRSLGCAPAIKLAHDLQLEEGRPEPLGVGEPPRALILEAPFASIPAMASEVMPHLGKPDWMVFNLFDNLGRASEINVPVFQYHGRKDEVIPFEQGEQVHAALAGRKEFMALDDTGHNNIWDSDARANNIRKRVDAFLKKIALPDSQAEANCRGAETQSSSFTLRFCPRLRASAVEKRGVTA